MMEFNEYELLESLKNDDHEAYGRLFDKYWKLAFKVAHQKCGDKDDALDIVQNVFIQLWENRAKLSVRGSFTAWLIAVVEYKTIDWYRSTQKREAQKELLLQQLEAQSASVANEACTFTMRELQKDWQEAVNDLPERMKEIYLLSNQGNLSIAEIAQQLSLQPQSVKNHLYKAKERIRKTLSQHFYFWSYFYCIVFLW